ncbi:hypothetical protein D1872_248950 [compost metagenome]
MVCFRIEHIYFTVELIVDLPAYNGRMSLIMVSHLTGNSRAQLPIFRTAVIIVTTHTVLIGHALRRCIQHFWIAVCQPSWWCCCWCTHNDFQFVLMGQVQNLVEELKLKPALLRLQNGPGKFSNANI